METILMVISYTAFILLIIYYLHKNDTLHTRLIELLILAWAIANEKTTFADLMLILILARLIKKVYSEQRKEERK